MMCKKLKIFPSVSTSDNRGPSVFIKLPLMHIWQSYCICKTSLWSILLVSWIVTNVVTFVQVSKSRSQIISHRIQSSFKNSHHRAINSTKNVKIRGAYSVALFWKIIQNSVWSTRFSRQVWNKGATCLPSATKQIELPLQPGRNLREFLPIPPF